MKYSDFLHESEVKHNTISYNLLTPKPVKGKSLKPEKIKVDASKAISLLAPYTYVRVLEQVKAVVPLAAYLFLFQLFNIKTTNCICLDNNFRFSCRYYWFSNFYGRS